MADQNAACLSFLDSKWKSLEKWKRVARPQFLRLLHYAPRAEPLGAKLVAREERDGFVIESLRISATPAYDLRAWLLLPTRRHGKVPGVVAQHCHGGCFVWGHEKLISHRDDPEHARRYRQNAYGRAYVEELARRGYAVLVIDAFYFGRRRLRVEDMDPDTSPPYFREKLKALRQLPPRTDVWLDAVNSLCGDYEHLTAKTLFTAGVTWPGILNWDDRRAVDYLGSRPEVDATRLGAVGLSLGGIRTAYLIAADPRIKAACVVGWMPDFRGLIYDHLRWHTWMVYIPGLTAILNAPDAAALTAPSALLVQQCSQDGLYPLESMQSAVAKLERIYAKAGIPERFRGAFHDLPHKFSPPMQEEAFDWLDRWLKA
jgi:dienelactone hydrolase